MEYKTCSRCGGNKLASDFDASRSYCKECRRARARENYHKNREKRLAQAAVYRQAHREDLKQYFRDRYRRHRDEILAKQKKYAEKHREEKIEYLRRYYRENKERLRAQQKAKQRERVANDPLYKFKRQMGLLLWRAFNRRGQVSPERAKEIIGCSLEEYTAYLKQTWLDRYGEEWSGQPCNIDHITPLHTARTIEEVKALCRFTNLQLLTPEDNFAKGKSLDWGGTLNKKGG